MKKILCLLFALLLCLSLCACGMDQRADRPGSGTDILPDVSPMASPDVSDGRVQDGDGFIGNGEGGAGAAASPMPSAGPVPGTNSPMPTTAPTTAPGASPNP
jgi:hypothetical protein